jgi:hypothetical protein
LLIKNMPRQHARLIELNHGSSISVSYERGSTYIVNPDYKDYAYSLKPRVTRQRQTEHDQIENEYRALEEELSAAKFILGIENELDDPNFLPYSNETLERASSFVLRLAIHAHACGFSGLGVPEVLPSSKGSIDLLWNSPTRKLLMNFPADDKNLVSFYGKKGSSELSGRFEPGSNRPELIYWLVE